MKGTEEQPERADVREELQRKKEMLERCLLYTSRCV